MLETKKDTGSIPGLGRSSGRGNGHLLQYSYLENPMDRGAWQATVTKSWTQLITGVTILLTWGTARLSSRAAASFNIISSVWRFQFLNTLPILNYLFFKNYYKIRPSGCIMKSGISPWFGFAFFLITSDIEHIFMYLLTSCMSFLENYIQVLCPVKNWIFF